MKREQKVKLRIYYAIALLIIAAILSLCGCQKEPIEPPVAGGVVNPPQKSQLDLNKEYIVGRWEADSLFINGGKMQFRRLLTFTEDVFTSYGLYPDYEYKLISVSLMEVLRENPLIVDTFKYEMKGGRIEIDNGYSVVYAKKRDE